MATILGANTLSSGYDVANSLRLNSGDSAQMNKTLGTATDVDKYTISMWVKRARLGHRQMMMRVIDPSSTGTYAFLEFQSGDNLASNDYDESGSIAKITNAKFRDPNAWMHIVLALDSTQGTASNRSKLYVNGTQITSFGTDSGGSQNQNLMGNTSGKNIYIGGDGGQDTRYCGLYMAEVCFIDGQQLTPTSFGEFDEDSPTIWKPIDVSGLTFGNNGFYLDFEDSSNLGNDANGGTDLTEVNIVATDQSTDTCTNNFATLNPLTTWMSSDFNLSEGNLKIDIGNNTEGKAALATFGLTTGKWYWEVKYISTSSGASHLEIGFVDTVIGLRYHIRGNDGERWDNGSSSSGTNHRHDPDDIIGVYVDADNQKWYLQVNGSNSNGGNGAADVSAGTGFIHQSFAVTDFILPYFANASGGGGHIFEVNFGNAPFTISSSNSDANGHGSFEYDPTNDGVNFYALNSKNLAEFG